VAGIVLLGVSIWRLVLELELGVVLLSPLLLSGGVSAPVTADVQAQGEGSRGRRGVRHW
jgi:hypothetical protein